MDHARAPTDAPTARRRDAFASKGKQVQEWATRREVELEQSRKIGWALATARRYGELNGSVVAAQLTFFAAVAVIPIAIIAFAWLQSFRSGASVADVLVAQFDLTGETARVVQGTFASAEASRALATLIGVGGFAVVGISLAQTMHEVLARAWRRPVRKDWRSQVRAMAWFVLLMAEFGVVELCKSTIEGGLHWWTPLAVAGSATAAFGFWLLTPGLLLAGNPGWRAFVPTAWAGLASMAALRVAAIVAVPEWLEYYGLPFGAVGVLLALLFWIWIVFSAWVGVVAFGAVWWERGAARTPEPGPAPGSSHV